MFVTCLDSALDGMDPVAIQVFGILTGFVVFGLMFACDVYLLSAIRLECGCAVDWTVRYLALYPLLKINGSVFHIVNRWSESEYLEWLNRNPQAVQGVPVARAHRA